MTRSIGRGPIRGTQQHYLNVTESFASASIYNRAANFTSALRPCRHTRQGKEGEKRCPIHDLADNNRFRRPSHEHLVSKMGRRFRALHHRRICSNSDFFGTELRRGQRETENPFGTRRFGEPKRHSGLHTVSGRKSETPPPCQQPGENPPGKILHSRVRICVPLGEPSRTRIGITRHHVTPVRLSSLADDRSGLPRVSQSLRKSNEV